QDAISQLKKPFPEAGLPSIEPLIFSTLSVQAGTEVMHFVQNYKNFTIIGLTTGNVTKFDIQFQEM
ncbi:JHBP domain containing protein, partial [Asbolus verrucosus]